MEKLFKEMLKEQQKQTKILKSIESRLKDNVDMGVQIDGEEFAKKLSNQLGREQAYGSFPRQR